MTEPLLAAAQRHPDHAGRPRKVRPAPDPSYLLPEQIADMLQVSVKSIYRWAKDDATMPVLRVNGATIRFPRERLERWLRDREQGAPRIRRQVRSAPKSASSQGAQSA